MTRVLMTYLLPLVLPIAVYLVWTWISGKGERGEGDPPRWYEGPWFWLILAGFGLMVSVLAVTAILQGNDPSATYVPPHVEDGNVVPGQFK